MKFNSNLYKLENKNSFSTAIERIKAYKSSHQNNKVISLGIGDVGFPIVSHIADKMIEAIKKESGSEFVGYGNYCGIPELIDAIRVNEYPNFSNMTIKPWMEQAYVITSTL